MYILSNQKQPSCKKRSAALEKAMVKKDVKSKSRNFDTGWVLCHISVVFIPIPFKPQKDTPTMVAPST